MERSFQKVVLVGEAPGRATDPARPLSGRTGAALERLAGLPPGSLPEAFELVNVLDRWPGRSGCGPHPGDGFPLGEARKAARRLLRTLVGRRVILLGGRVCRALGVSPEPILAWREVIGIGGAIAVAVVPHPSGVNHWWNDPANRSEAAEFMASAAPPSARPPGGEPRLEPREPPPDREPPERVEVAEPLDRPPVLLPGEHQEG
jgi:uracil-DNA glycosylase